METEMNTASKQINLSTLLVAEDQLDLQMSPVTQDVAISEINNCNEFLTLNNRNINHLVTEIPNLAIDFLYKKSMEMVPRSGNYVTSLRLHFAVEQDAITLLFEPVIATRPSNVLSEPTYSVVKGENYYAYDPSTKSFVEAGKVDDPQNALISAYKANIGIKHRGESTFNPFKPNLDTEAVIFPFQTLYTLMRDNRAESVFFYNSIRKEDIGTSYGVKHCLLLSAKSLPAEDLLQSYIYEGTFANRSHLCPPSCNVIQHALNLPK